MSLKLFIVYFVLLFAWGQGAIAGGAAKQRYILNCAGCHGFDGAGSEINGIPDMRHKIGHFLRTQEGREFLVQVPGVSNSALTNKEVSEVLAWLLDNFSATEVPKNAKPYSEEEVMFYRKSVPADVTAKRARVIASLREMGYSPRISK